MDNEILEEIWDYGFHPQLTIDNGMMFFQRNPQLCFSKIKYLLDNSM